MIPLIILAIEDESSREFMIWLYESSVDRMLREARKYFSRQEDIEDIVSESVAKLETRLIFCRSWTGVSCCPTR